MLDDFSATVEKSTIRSERVLASKFMTHLHNVKLLSRSLGRTRYSLTCAALCLAALGSVTSQTICAQQDATEYQVKAAYLFNLLKFVDWPEDASSDAHAQWLIGVVGENPFGAELGQIALGKTAQGHDLKLRQFEPGEDLRECHLLFISTSERKRLPTIMAHLRGSSVLTVADMDRFIESGGMIQFVTEQSRVRFGIDLGATTRVRLKVSSKLLPVARTATGSGTDGND